MSDETIVFEAACGDTIDVPLVCEADAPERFENRDEVVAMCDTCDEQHRYGLTDDALTQLQGDIDA